MCLGIPGRITEIWQQNGAVHAHADFAGQMKKICLNYLPDLQVGDYTIVHAGFALTRLEEDEAHKTLAMMRQYGLLPASDEPVVTSIGAQP